MRKNNENKKNNYKKNSEYSQNMYKKLHICILYRLVPAAARKGSTRFHH